ncbi:hypothetical protein OJF2_43850 [Aquisphaera giovannonii]|uniref:Effector-associated domain-containing protein n=1 Tax=Aquisphaera giovannonii TaxID=406548 RepID=A0A5B9W5F5_9BACT|nr:effector-associated domain EAD1-containing protein [Aquisphaera giovannonii]QEH35828.1 hypothetical protein OJF2_43850 [Aquisphaera giovannonii]
MHRLSGTEVKQLHSALLSGFSYADLDMLMKIDLDQRLDSIVPPGSLSTAAFELVMWAEREGRTADLIKAVIAARPNNKDVAALGQLLDPAPAGAAPAAAVADRQRRLRGLLLDQFPRPSDLKILVFDALGQELDHVAGGENQTDICFNLVQWLWVDPAGRLRPLLDTAVKARPNCADLKSLRDELSAG